MLDKTRRCRHVNGVLNVGTDDDESLLPDFAARIQKCVISLKFDCFNNAKRHEVPYRGQAAVLLEPKTGKKVFVNAKHNLVSEENRDSEMETCFPPHKCRLANGSDFRINLPNTGWLKEPTDRDAISLREGATWDYGIDMAFGPLVNETTAEKNWPQQP